MATKSELWEQWIEQTLIEDIQSEATPDPVPMIDDAGEDLDTTDTFDSYRYGRGDGEFLYMLYLAAETVEDAGDITPVYIGETNGVTSRLYDHFKKIRNSLPIDAWDDDGSWGSWSKYDHMAGVYEESENDLYAWILDVEDINEGPYGFQTYRQELEAKLVGLVHSQSEYDRVFANREFVPNRVVYEMGKIGPEWVSELPDSYTPTQLPGPSSVDLAGKSKADLCFEWIDRTICKDIRDASEDDPIPLFDTTDDLQVRLTDDGRLRRSQAIDKRIRREGKQCVHESGVRSDGPEALLYVLFQIDSDSQSSTPAPKDIVPRYIGKAEAYGKKNELSANFTEIAKDRLTTNSFARWGYGNYWHVGTLSNTVFGDGTKKLIWANELFEPGTRTLKQQTYLWIRAWDPAAHPGPYGHSVYVAEAEPLLVGLAQHVFPDRLLNHSEVPDDAPVKNEEYDFEPVKQ